MQKRENSVNKSGRGERPLRVGAPKLAMRVALNGQSGAHSGQENGANKPGAGERSLWLVDPRLSVRVALIADSQPLIARFLAHLRRETAVDVLKLVGQSTEHPQRASLAMAADFDLDGFLDRAGFACVMEEVGKGKEKRVVALWLTGETRPREASPNRRFLATRRVLLRQGRSGPSPGVWSRSPRRRL